MGGEVFEKDGFSYTINEDGNSVTISQYNGNGGDVVIPSEIDGKNVTGIGVAAFRECRNLTNVTIPDRVTSIGSGAFLGCNNLKSITIPDSVTSIESFVFSECSSLTSVTIPGSVTSIGDSAFRECRNLTNVTIPDRVTSIGDSAFLGCNNLKSITIPDSVTSIEASVFSGCSSLTSVTIPDSVTSIGYLAFYRCGLTSVTIPNKVGEIDESAFEGCPELSSIIVEEGNSRYDSRNGCNAIIEKETNMLIQGCNKTVIPVGVTGIGKNAFRGCSSLTSVIIPDGVISIELTAFYGCSSLTSVTIPDSVTSIGDSAFGSCSKNLVIYGKSGSEAERYANENKITFRLISGDEPSQEDKNKADISKASVTLSQTSYTYDGTAKTPSVTVKLDGKTLELNTDYTVAYSNNTNVGTAKATVTGKGNYTGSKTVNFTIVKAEEQPEPASKITCKKTVYKVAYGAKPFKINATSNSKMAFTSSKPKIAAVDKNTGKVTIKNTGAATITIKAGTATKKVTIKVSPKKPSVKSVNTAKGKKLTVKWAKDKMASGYQVQVSTDKKFKKNVKSKSLPKTSYTFTKLKAGKKYYVRMRSYKKSGKETLYSAWSKAKVSGKVKE